MLNLRTLTDKTKKTILIAVCVLAIGILFLAGRIPQDPAYHHFADTAVIAGLPNFWNVLSNLPFLLVGAYALWRAPRLAEQECRAAYWIMAIGICCVGLGSAYYHYQPNNATLLWDRLPMTVVFMALFATVISERVIVAFKRTALWFLLACGLASVLYWSWTETWGQGDLRPYVVVQFLPLLLTPLVIVLFAPKYLSNRLLIFAFGWYLIAKFLELYDLPIQQLIGVVGGHPLKHIAASFAALCIVRSVPVRVAMDSPHAINAGLK